MSDVLYLYDITVEESEMLYGPGKRIVIWTSGCSIRCEGCTNSHLWEIESGKKYSLKEVIDYIHSVQNVRGLTFHGGEPSDQMDEITKLIKSLGKKYDYILFTGKEIEEFKTPKDLEFISCFDIVKCGPFEKARTSRKLLFRGSTNQRIIYITNRIDVISEANKSTVIFKINEDCDITLQGFPTDSHYKIVADVSKGEKND